MFAATMEMGMCTGFPDVCITPVPPPVGQAPIPYPNVANCPLVEDASEKVFINGYKAIIKKSKLFSTLRLIIYQGGLIGDPGDHDRSEPNGDRSESGSHEADRRAIGPTGRCQGENR